MSVATKFAGFRFKQFNIEHQYCAMKVGTDGIMLGSWIPTGDYDSILDIGTGSGLIAIMLAQRTAAQCKIVGIDIDEQAVLQARQNAQNCPWTAKLQFHHQSLQQLAEPSQFDLIVSNPPYFEGKPGELTASDANYMSSNRRKARHDTFLNLSELLQSVSLLLTEQGYFYCILPMQSRDVCKQAEQYGLFCDRQMIVKSSPSKSAKRQLLRFGFKPSELVVEHLSIHNLEGTYSADYTKLCRDYYLNF